MFYVRTLSGSGGRQAGDVVSYNLTQDIFGAMTRTGTPKTFFRPDPAMHRQIDNFAYFMSEAAKDGATVFLTP